MNQTRVLHGHLKRLFLPQALQGIVSELISQLCRRLERQITQKGKVSLFGGLQIDQDVRTLMTFFTTITDIPVRQKFQRLSQMATLLSLEQVAELRDFFSQQKWHLSHHEIRTVLGLRFSKDQIETDVGYLIMR